MLKRSSYEWASQGIVRGLDNSSAIEDAESRKTIATSARIKSVAGNNCRAEQLFSPGESEEDDDVQSIVESTRRNSTLSPQKAGERRLNKLTLLHHTFISSASGVDGPRERSRYPSLVL
jgi:hypothetical protein